MTINHIDQLAQWYADAEQGAISEGDTLIIKVGGGYTVETSDFPIPDPADEVRILARAPKPKPAWHNAVAVIATWYDSMEDETITGVWTHDAGVWMHESGICVDAENLRDVTPLIKAKVTDEQVRKVLEHYYEAQPGETEWHNDIVTKMRLALAAALGVETE